GGAVCAVVRLDGMPVVSPVGLPPRGPDLVVGVLSAGDRAGVTLAKIADWLSAGARLVWVIDPEGRLARIYRQDGSESILGEADALEGEDVLPGFTCKLGAVLETIVPAAPDAERPIANGSGGEAGIPP